MTPSIRFTHISRYIAADAPPTHRDSVDTGFSTQKVELMCVQRYVPHDVPLSQPQSVLYVRRGLAAQMVVKGRSMRLRWPVRTSGMARV